MNIEIRKSFEKDALKLPGATQVQLAKVIDQLSRIEKLSDLISCKKLSGFKNAYRIRMGEYRIGFIFENGTVELVRVLGRKEIYKYFP
ncbi:type II toxin-antitoxin system RelE/ParE family toxin [Asinibacterium sp. OR53]|uniref:type II toxin-antitoxin system RelE family toxin n=1 Tax=Asinibacterium sp. OR53 TaxID=925409 RepID=UPI00047CD930|nr:type II toxin-antitoxin system RelE/ParE family toxin [Asinibacterium sp. OR53]